MSDRREQEEIRVLVVDDHAIVRKGICALLATEPQIAAVGEAANGQEAIDQARLLQPDVILMDIVMPEMDGLEAIRRISEQMPEIRILVLTSFASVDMVLPAIKAGALGYLLKDSGPQELVQAIRQVQGGNSSLHPAIARKLLDEISQPSAHGPEEDALTDREVTVLKLVAQGFSNRDIAHELTVSEATVRTHVSHILAKLELSSRTQAALYALRRGLVSLYDDALDD
ncbi:MAG: response regulator transcription factor [Anaerolineae bacterium]|nr:response regulator transcription factor [Anaerolineae bacterium]